MRISSLARRSLGTLAATALLTTGLTGLSMGVASAQTVTPNSVTKVPAGPAVNNATSSFTVSGSDFYPAGQMTVTLHPTFIANGQGDIATTVDAVDGCAKVGGVELPDTSCSGPVHFTADLHMAAPGLYDVMVSRQAQTTGTNAGPTPCSSCLQVFSAGPATVSAVAQNGTSNGNLTITGTNFANGATVVFYNTDSSGAATTPDGTLHFTSTPNYVNATTIQGAYTADSGAGGVKVVRVFNIDDAQTAGPGGAFVQPRVNSIAPTALGQGANTVNVTVTGAGFDSNTTAAWSDPNVTVAGPLVAASNGASVVVPTSVASGTSLGGKSLTLKGTGGGYTTAPSVLTVTAAPVPTSLNLPQRGQNSSTTVAINGSGFTTGTAFDFGDPKVTAVTLPSTTATVAQVTLTVASDATPGTRNVRATNPDHGTATLTNGLTIVPMPVISDVVPASSGPNKSIPVTIHGSNFSTSGVSLAVSGTGVSVGTVNVDPSGNSLTTTFTLASDAAPGPRDITITNNSSQGKSVCAGCFGVNSLSIDQPSSTLNNAVRQLSFSGAGLDPASTVVTLTIPGPQTYQAPLVGTNVPCQPVAANTLCATFDFNNRAGHGVATGHYTATATTGSTVLTCTACFPVAAPAAPTVTGLAPATGGQGATNRSITITGTNFSPGESVVFTGTGITTNSVTWDSPTQLTAVYSIAGNATTGPRGLRVTNPDPDNSGGSSAADAFTVDPGPTTTATNTSVLGQGATAVDVTLTGTGYAAGAVADFGPGTSSVTKSVSATTLVATVTVSGTADTAPVRDIRVTNSDGGSSVLAAAFHVSPAPQITTISPGAAQAGQTKTVTITGSGFTTSPPTTSGTTTCPTPANGTCPTLTIAGITPTVKTVSADGTTMTADFVVSPSAPISQPGVKVINPDHGQSIKLAGFRIATVPVAPTSVAVPVTGNHTAQVTWAFPTTTNADGGTPITGFVVDDGDATTNNAQNVAADVRSANLTGLVNGRTYTFTVKALNAIGAGPAGTAQGTAFGLPTAPTSLSAVSRDTAIQLSFAGADPQGRAITAYRVHVVRTSDGLSPVADKDYAAPTALVTGLVNGVTYRFTAAAKNSVGYSSFSSASVLAVPKYATRLTSTRSPFTGSAGSSVTYSGSLFRISSGAVLPNQTVRVTLTPDVGGARTVAVATNSSGVWSFRFAPTYNETVRATFAGAGINQPATAAPYRMGVAPRVVRQAPASGAVSAHTATINVTGYITPNKAGRIVYLRRGTSLIGSAKVATNGTFSIPSKLPAGTYTLNIFIPGSPGNVAGSSPSFTIRRT